MDCIINNRFYRRVSGVIIPVFTYTGTFTTIDDGNNNWRIKFLTSGNLIFSDLGSAINGIDVFMVGGGGGNGNSQQITDWCAAGGGGYTKTAKNITVQTGEGYEIIVGSGGTRPTVSNTQTRGGTSTAFGISAEGGYSGKAFNGGDGGSGGAGSNSKIPGANGGNGEAGTVYGAKGGIGQGTTTREFGDENAQVYATGGYFSPQNGINNQGNGTLNSGDGGGGTDNNTKHTIGGSGIVIIRNHRN